MVAAAQRVNGEKGLGAELSNTAPTSSKGESPATCGGFDTLEISIYGKQTDVYRNQVWRKLHQEQEQLRSGDPIAGEVKLPQGRVCQVAATGSGRGRNYLPYRIEVAGITIALPSPSPGEEDEEGPAKEERIAKVELGSLILMTEGHRGAWAKAAAILRDVGIEVTNTKVSRADVCVDLPEVDVEDFVDLWFAGNRVSRAKGSQIFFEGLKKTGFSAGSSNCRLRVYEKRIEMRSQEGTAKFCAIRDQRWGGVVPEKATRVEFQVRRDFLRDTASIDTVEQLFDRVADLTRYLTQEWFRLTATNPDAENKNQTKAEDAECWRRVVDDFEAWTGQIVHRIERREAPLPDNIALEQQLVGIVETLAALAPDPVRGHEQLKRIMDRALLKVEALRREGESVRHRVVAKRSKLAARGVLDYIKNQAELNQRNAWDLHPEDCFCEKCRDVERHAA